MRVTFQGNQNCAELISYYGGTVLAIGSTYLATVPDSMFSEIRAGLEILGAFSIDMVVE